MAASSSGLSQITGRCSPISGSGVRGKNKKWHVPCWSEEPTRVTLPEATKEKTKERLPEPQEGSDNRKSSRDRLGRTSLSLGREPSTRG